VTSAVFAIPGDINLATGGYAYDRRVLALLPEHGIAVSHLELPGSFPSPTAAHLAETTALLSTAAGAGTVVIIDGLAYGALPVTNIAPITDPIVALVHHPLCLEAGLSAQRQQELRALETAALAHAKRVIVTSPLTARTLAADFAVPPNRITVAEPGTDRAQRARGSGSPLHIVAVGSIVPRKAYDVLVRALGDLKDRNWHLTIAGPADRSPAALEALKATIGKLGLGDRIALAGPLPSPELDSLYAQADLFVLPSLYEGYGMVLAEAMARGLPIVCTTGGAAAETVPDDAALKVPPGDESSLAKALDRVLGDSLLRKQMSDASWASGQKLPSWNDTARIIAGVIKEVAP
jgi:glycosyltransferase involved in cell wall biosynthesis